MKQVISNNVAIHYTIHGQGAITLLLVHGSFIDGSYWAEQVAYFEQHYRVVVMDLAGHGQSGTDRKHWTTEGLADDIVCLMKELQLQNVILVGHSLGGDLVLMAADKYPDAVIGIIVVDYLKNAATPLAEHFRNQVQGILDSAQKDLAGTNEQYARMALLTPETPAFIIERVVADYRKAYPPMALATLPEFFVMDKIERRILPKLKWKLHLINVDYIPTNREPLEKYVAKGFDLKEIPGTSHYPMLENLKALNEALNKDINEIIGEQL